MDTLFNLRVYTPLELGLFAAGGALWVAAYVVLLRRSLRLEYVEMPVVAGCCNIAWEALWSTVLHTDMGQLFEWCYLAWLVLDVFIFWNLLKYGYKQFELPVLRQHFKPIAVAFTLLMAALMYTFSREGLDTPIGARSAYAAQLAISIPYYLLLAKPEQRALLSLAIAWLRSLGTGLISVFVFLHHHEDSFLLTAAAATLLLDGGFLVLLHRLQAKEPVGAAQASAA